MKICQKSTTDLPPTGTQSVEGSENSSQGSQTLEYLNE